MDRAKGMGVQTTPGPPPTTPPSAHNADVTAQHRAVGNTTDSRTVGKVRKPRKRCSTEGCTNVSQRAGLCERHGAHGVCNHAECTTYAVRRGYCWKHGAFGQCMAVICTTNAYDKSGFCWKHGGGARGECSMLGCTTKSQTRGMCKTHATLKCKRFCTHSGCNSGMVKNDLCHKHGAHGPCTTPGM